MGWCVGPDRFMTGNRSWISRWRFQPVEKLADALRLLEVAAPAEYILRGDSEGNIRVHVRIGGATGEACSASKARAITWAIARAVGIEVEP
jgi:ribosomal protein S9